MARCRRAVQRNMQRAAAEGANGRKRNVRFRVKRLQNGHRTAFRKAWALDRQIGKTPHHQVGLIKDIIIYRMPSGFRSQCWGRIVDEDAAAVDDAPILTFELAWPSSKFAFGRIVIPPIRPFVGWLRIGWQWCSGTHDDQPSGIMRPKHWAKMFPPHGAGLIYRPNRGLISIASNPDAPPCKFEGEWTDHKNRSGCSATQSDHV